ncbi:MAG: hypothetical protein ACREIA_16575 [Opitutaceae bacterium]
MAPPTKHAEKPGAVTFKVADKEHNFRWQMYFNTFEITRVKSGCFVSFAYIHQGSETYTAAEIVPVFFSYEGMLTLRDSTREYLSSMAAEPLTRIPLPPGVRRFSPLFANYARLARSGESAEVGLFTIPLHTIAAANKGQIRETDVVHAVPVALLHSDLRLHMNLVVSILDSIDS